MYQCKFYDYDDLVMTLEIEGDNRIEVLRNILNEEWTQVGYFSIENHEIDDIILNLLFGSLNPDSNDYDDDIKYKEYLYRIKTHLDYGLNLRNFLSHDNREINSIDVVEFFCKQIKEEFEQSNDTLKIRYKIERI